MEPAGETGRRLALLVATSVYSDPDLRQLRAPGHDADQLAEVLGDPRIGGFDVQVLINPASGQVQEGIEDFCTDRHPGDQLLIYLSCHGVLDSYGRLYYAAANTRRQRLAATAVAAAWLNERLEDCRARRQILVLDCCHSGAFAKGAKGDAGLALQDRFEPRGRGRVVLTASRSTEYSFEGGQASGEGVPSVFTHAIVNGLRTGDADRDKDGLITVTDLYQYVYDRVRAAEPRQTPELWTYGAEGSLLVAHSVRGAVIEPEPLPEDLRVTLESPRRRVRETAVAELADLLDGPQPGLALTARQALERIADEDHPQVAALARIAVAAPPGAAADQVRRELTDRAHREEHARQEAARRQAEEQARREVTHGEKEPLSQASKAATSTSAPDRDAQLGSLPDRALAAASSASANATPPMAEIAPDPANPASDQAVVGPAIAPAPSPDSGDHRTALLPHDGHRSVTAGDTRPSPGEAIPRASRRRVVGARFSRRSIIIATGAAIAVIGLVAAIVFIVLPGLPAPHMAWTYTTGSRVESSPAVAGGTVYIGNNGNKLYALDAATGHLRWTYPISGGPAFSSPIVAGGTVYIGSASGKVYALDAATGHLNWAYLTTTQSLSLLSTPAAAGGTVYIGGDNGKVYALDAATGHLRWTYPTKEASYAAPSPAVASGVVYVGSNNGKVYALDAATGRLQWTYTVGGPILASLAVASGTVYVGSNDGKVYALDAATGRLQWTYPTEKNLYPCPAVAGGTVYVGTNNGKVYALDAATGRLQWAYTTGAQILDCPAVAGGTVYVGSDDHQVYALDAATGQPRWAYTTEGAVRSTPAVAGGTVYVGSDDHRVYALSAGS